MADDRERQRLVENPRGTDNYFFVLFMSYSNGLLSFGFVKIVEFFTHFLSLFYFLLSVTHTKNYMQYLKGQSRIFH